MTDPRRTLTRLLVILAGTAAAIGLFAGPAFAAGHGPVGKGFIGVTIPPAAEVFLPPGKAVQLAQATCGTAGHALIPVGTVLVGTVLVQPGDLTVDAVRLAFPGTVTVCTDVVLRSQVAADAAEAVETA